MRLDKLQWRHSPFISASIARPDLPGGGWLRIQKDDDGAYHIDRVYPTNSGRDYANLMVTVADNVGALEAQCWLLHYLGGNDEAQSSTSGSAHAEVSAARGQEQEARSV